MSLPRDLKVQIPGHGTDKINAAYELGGPALTLKTVKQLTGLSINHVINVDFQGFQTAIDAIGCIYADIDRRYFNDSAGYAYINVPAGYQKLCGERGARVRALPPRGLRPRARRPPAGPPARRPSSRSASGKLVKDRDKLIEIFGKYTTSDAGAEEPRGDPAACSSWRCSPSASRSARSTSRASDHRRATWPPACRAT